MSVITPDAQVMLITIGQYCRNAPEVWSRAIQHAEQLGRGIVAADVEWAMRNLGKPKGSELPAGTASRPMTLTWTPDPTDSKHREAY